MGLVLTVTGGLVVWIVLWALGAKGFDAFLLVGGDHPDRGRTEDPDRLPARSPQLSAGVLARWLGLAALAVGAARARGLRRRRLGRERSDRQPARDLLEPAAAGARPRRPRSRSSTARSSRCRRPEAASGAFRSATSRSTTPNRRAALRSPGAAETNAKTGRAGHQHDRLPRRLRLRRDGRLAAADQRGGDPAGQPVEPVRRADLLARRRPGRARTLLPERQADVRAAAARRHRRRRPRRRG